MCSLLRPSCRGEKFEERIANLSLEKRQWHEQEFRKKECDFLRARRIRIGANDFRTLQVIGKGAFGTVKLVQKVDNGKLYAMKMLRKTEMIKHDQARSRFSSRHFCLTSSSYRWHISSRSETSWLPANLHGLSSCITLFKMSIICTSF